MDNNSPMVSKCDLSIEQNAETITGELQKISLKELLITFKQQMTEIKDPNAMTWSEIKKLFLYMTVLKERPIPWDSWAFPSYFIKVIISYINIVIGYLSSQFSSFAKLISQTVEFLTPVLTIFVEERQCNIFLQRATKNIFDMLWQANYSRIVQRQLLHVFNVIINNSSQEIRNNMGNENIGNLYRLFDLLLACGEYLVQIEVMKTIFNLFGDKIKHKELKYKLLPEHAQLEKELINIDVDDFYRSARNWLNKLNRRTNRVSSFKHEKIKMGKANVTCPKEGDSKWLDFNMEEKMASFYSNDWNRIFILAKNVEKVELKSSKYVILSIHQTEACVSEDFNQQTQWDNFDKNIRIYLIDASIDKLKPVLQHIFGDKFSPKVLTGDQSIYKPLAITKTDTNTTMENSKTMQKLSSSGPIFFNHAYTSGITSSLDISLDGEDNIISDDSTISYNMPEIPREFFINTVEFVDSENEIIEISDDDSTQVESEKSFSSLVVNVGILESQQSESIRLEVNSDENDIRKKLVTDNADQIVHEKPIQKHPDEIIDLSLSEEIVIGDTDAESRTTSIEIFSELENLEVRSLQGEGDNPIITCKKEAQKNIRDKNIIDLDEKGEEIVPDIAVTEPTQKAELKEISNDLGDVIDEQPREESRASSPIISGKIPNRCAKNMCYESINVLKIKEKINNINTNSAKQLKRIKPLKIVTKKRLDTKIEKNATDLDGLEPEMSKCVVTKDARTLFSEESDEDTPLQKKNPVPQSTPALSINTLFDKIRNEFLDDLDDKENIQTKPKRKIHTKDPDRKIEVNNEDDKMDNPTRTSPVKNRDVELFVPEEIHDDLDIAVSSTTKKKLGLDGLAKAAHGISDSINTLQNIMLPREKHASPNHIGSPLVKKIKVVEEAEEPEIQIDQETFNSALNQIFSGVDSLSSGVALLAPKMEKFLKPKKKK